MGGNSPPQASTGNLGEERLKGKAEQSSRIPSSQRLHLWAAALPSVTQEAPDPFTKVGHFHFITSTAALKRDYHKPHMPHHIAKEQGLLKKGIGQCPLTSTISSSSGLSMQPFPSLSYTLNVHLSLCSSFPRKTRFKAATYSRKSMVLSCGNRETAAG